MFVLISEELLTEDVELSFRTFCWREHLGTCLLDDVIVDTFSAG